MTDREIRNAALAFLTGMIELVLEDECKDAMYERYDAADAARMAPQVALMAMELIGYAGQRWYAQTPPPAGVPGTAQEGNGA